MSESGTIASWVGLLLKPKTEILLVCSKGKARDQIERLFCAGFFNIKGHNGFTIEEWETLGQPLWHPRLVTAKAMVETSNITNLDVRSLAEWKQTGVIKDSKLISLGELPYRIAEVRELPNLYINCKTGGRARVACSILARNGTDSVIVADSK
jgi:rhodanese-related sulfurtransferase